MVDAAAAAATLNAMKAEAEAAAGGVALPAPLSAAVATAARAVAAGEAPPVETALAVLEEHHHYWEERSAGRALAMLEDEMEEIAAEADGNPASEGGARLRRLLELECQAVAASAERRRQSPDAGASDAGRPVRRPRVRLPSAAEAGALSDVLRPGAPGLQLDAGATAARNGGREQDYGPQRLSNVADTWAGRELDPRKVRQTSKERVSALLALTSAQGPEGDNRPSNLPESLSLRQLRCPTDLALKSLNAWACACVCSF